MIEIIDLSKRRFLKRAPVVLAATSQIIKQAERSLLSAGLGLFQAPAFVRTRSAADFEAEMGTSPLSVEQALAFLPLITAMYGAAKSFPFNSDQAASDFILLHGDVEDPQQPGQSTLAANLIREYKNLPLTDKLIAGLINHPYAETGFFDPNLNKVFLFLDNINNPGRLLNERGIRLLAPPIAVMGDPQNGMTCSLATPAMLFRYLSLHEGDHYAKKTQQQKLEDVVLQSWIRITQQLYPTAPTLEYGSADKTNLVVYIEAHLGGVKQDPNHLLLNEALTDLSANSVAVKNGLPDVISNYASPYDLLNLRRMLKQAKIDEAELDRISLASDIVGFLTRLAKAAIDRSEYSPEENLDFMLARFNRNQRISMPRWGNPNRPIQQYYPEVEEVSPPYSLTKIANNGCI